MYDSIVKTEQYDRYLLITKVNDTYDVVDSETASVVMEDLYLWGAAYALVLALVERRFADVDVITFLEAKYVKHVKDMMIFQHTGRYDMYLNEKIEAEALMEKIYSFCKNDK